MTSGVAAISASPSRQGGAAQAGAAQGSAAPDAAEHAAGYPPTVVELTVANSTGVLQLVRDGKAGLGFIETPHLPSDLVTEHVRDDELLVVAAPGHPWASRRRPLGLAEIAATPLVMREAGSGTRDTLTDHLAAQDPPLRPRIAMELGTSAAVRSAIAAGVGPGVLSRLAVRDDLVLGRLVAVEVAGPPLTRQLTAVWRPDDPLPPEGQRLLAVATAAIIAPISPPKNPDQVLFGDNRGQSFGPFKAFPTAKAAMSADQVTAKARIVQLIGFGMVRSQESAMQGGPR